MSFFVFLLCFLSLQITGATKKSQRNFFFWAIFDLGIRAESGLKKRRKKEEEEEEEEDEREERRAFS